MHKCRLCLAISKNVKCLFDIDSILGISYAEIINSFANVKVSKCDGMTDQICLSCRRKTKEFWDFKLKIERSTNALQENSLVKRVHFTNIYDIKFSKVAIEEDIKKPIPIDFTEDFIKNSNGFIYKDIVIKKVSKDVKEPLSVIGFLSSIKGENENDYQDDSGYEVENDYDPDLNHDPDYNMSQQRKKKIKNKSQTDKANKKCVMILEKPIKPVFLADYSVVPSRQRPSALKKRKSKEKYICPYCGKMNTNLKSHLLTHSDMKPFKCETCSKTFATEKQLSVHMNQTHGRKDQKCNLCEAVFTTKYRLNSHMKNRHCPEKKNICDVCNKLWKNRYRLMRHIQLVHSFGPKPFQCELCPDRFNSSFGLKHHLRVHTGERPYNCQLCSQPYSYKHDFNRHCFKKHGVWFYRRTVHVMNEQVLAQERVLMRDLLLRLNGVLKDDKPINPFEGPQAALAFDVMMKVIQSGQLVVDLQL